MATWTKEELEKIRAAEELGLSSLRSVGTLRSPVAASTSLTNKWCAWRMNYLSAPSTDAAVPGFAVPRPVTLDASSQVAAPA